MEPQMLTNNMIFRILPTQIPYFWEAIKFACKEADEVKKEEMQNYFNELLQALLSDKAQCFVALDENKILHSIAVTRIVVDKVQHKNELLVQCLYSMTMMDDESVRRYFSFIASFASQVKCELITYNSSNPRIWKIAEVLGCTERYRSFSYPVGGK
jgi:hypothetical protein